MVLAYRQGQIKLNNLFPNILGILNLRRARVFMEKADVYQTV